MYTHNAAGWIHHLHANWSTQTTTKQNRIPIDPQNWDNNKTETTNTKLFMKLCNTFFGLWLKPSNVKLPHFPLAPAVQTLQTLKCVSEVQSQAHKSFAGRLFLRKSLQNSPTLLLQPDCAPSWTEREKGWKVVLVWEENLGKVDQSAARCCLSPHRAQKKWNC